jgi:hypothetical protein
LRHDHRTDHPDSLARGDSQVRNAFSRQLGKPAQRLAARENDQVSAVSPVSPVSPLSPVGPVGPVGTLSPFGPVGLVGTVSPFGPLSLVGTFSPVGRHGLIELVAVRGRFASDRGRYRTSASPANGSDRAGAGQRAGQFWHWTNELDPSDTGCRQNPGNRAADPLIALDANDRGPATSEGSCTAVAVAMSQGCRRYFWCEPCPERRWYVAQHVCREVI